ncbi:HEAT repeat domain-containing protein, partial [bacterium]
VLTSPDRQTLRTGATILENVGQPSDLPVLLNTLNQRIQLTVQKPRWTAVKDDDHSDLEGWQLQDDCLILIRACRALLEEGATLPANSASTPAGFILKPANRVAALKHPIPFVRQMTLEALKPVGNSPQKITVPASIRALLPALIQDPDPSVRVAACEVARFSQDKTLLPNVLELAKTAKNRWVIGSANSAVSVLGSRYEGWVLWANRLDEPGQLYRALENLVDVVKHSGYGTNTNSSLNREQIKALKAKWLQFLKSNRARLEAGNLFSLDEPAWPKGLFPPQFVPGPIPAKSAS